MQVQVNLIRLKELLRKVFPHASIIVAGKSIHISYECVDGDIIDEFIEDKPGGFNALSIFRYAFIRARSVELIFSNRNGKFRVNIMLTYNVDDAHTDEVSFSDPMERRRKFTDIVEDLKHNPPQGSSGVRPYTFSPEFKSNLNDEQCVREELGRILDWIDSRAEKRTVVNLPALSRWNSALRLIERAPNGAEIEILKPRTIEDINRASAIWNFDFEGSVSWSTFLGRDHKMAFSELLEICDDFSLEIGNNEGFSGIGFSFGINDIMV